MKKPVPSKRTAAAPAKKPSSAVAVKKPGTVAKSAAALFAAHKGAGLENVKASDLLVPRIGILQQLSPQLKKNKPEYDADAEEGDIYDVGLHQILGKEITFIPIMYQKVFLEWYPRESGRGLARIHTDDAIMQETTLDDKNRPTLENGNYVAETAQFYGFVVTDKGYRLSFIPMGSTQLKKARQWLTMVTGEEAEDDDGNAFTPPLFYRSYTLSTVAESNVQGDWWGWKIERGAATQEFEDFASLFKTLVESHRQLSSGQAKGDMSGIGDDGADNSESM